MRDNEDYFAVDVIDNLVEKTCSLNQPEAFGELNDYGLNFSKDVVKPQAINCELLRRSNLEPSLPSIESPPLLKLKPLLDSLKYVFLDPNKTLLVIIATDLTQE